MRTPVSVTTGILSVLGEAMAQYLTAHVPVTVYAQDERNKRHRKPHVRFIQKKQGKE